MINEPKKNYFQPKETLAPPPPGASTGAARRIAEMLSAADHAHKSVRPVTFNGLLTNKILTQLPGEDFARLLRYLVPVSLSPGEDLYGFRGNIRNIYFPETAVISHLHVLEDGSTTSAVIIGREGLVGLSTLFGTFPPLYYTQVLVGGSALKVEAEVIRQEFARGGAMQRLMLSYTGARLAQLSQRAVCNSRHRVDERLCTWLLMIHDRVGEEQLRLTHEEISHQLGFRRAGVTTACNLLRDNGTINYSRGTLRVIDRQKLEASACECYRALESTVEDSLSLK